MSIVSWLEAHQLPCFVKQHLHVDCPGCGFQRSFVLLLKGNFLESIILYPALLPVLSLFAFLGLHLVFKLRHGADILKWNFILAASLILLNFIVKLLA